MGFLSGKFPRIHIAFIGMQGFTIDRDIYMNKDLYKCYDTRQKIGDFTGGLHRLLSAWHLRGRYADRSGRATAAPREPRNSLPAERLKARLWLPPDLRVTATRQLIAR